VGLGFPGAKSFLEIREKRRGSQTADKRRVSVSSFSGPLEAEEGDKAAPKLAGGLRDRAAMRSTAARTDSDFTTCLALRKKE